MEIKAASPIAIFAEVVFIGSIITAAAVVLLDADVSVKIGWLLVLAFLIATVVAVWRAVAANRKFLAALAGLFGLASVASCFFLGSPPYDPASFRVLLYVVFSLHFVFAMIATCLLLGVATLWTTLALLSLAVFTAMGFDYERTLQSLHSSAVLQPMTFLGHAQDWFDFVLWVGIPGAIISVLAPARRLFRVLNSLFARLSGSANRGVLPWWGAGLFWAFAIAGSTNVIPRTFDIANPSSFTGLVQPLIFSIVAIVGLALWAALERAAGRSIWVRRAWKWLTPVVVPLVLFLGVSGILIPFFLAIFCVWGLAWQRFGHARENCCSAHWSIRMIHIGIWLLALQIATLIVGICRHAGYAIRQVEPIEKLSALAMWPLSIAIAAMMLAGLLGLGRRTKSVFGLDIFALLVAFLLVGVLNATAGNTQVLEIEIEQALFHFTVTLGLILAVTLGAALLWLAQSLVAPRSRPLRASLKLCCDRVGLAAQRAGILSTMFTVSAFWFSLIFVPLAIAWSRLFGP